MKSIFQLLTLSLLGGTLLVDSAFADGPTTPATPTPLPNPGTVVNAQSLPQEIKQLEQKFDTDRAAYLAKEKALAEKLKNSTDDQRAKILEAMKDQRQKWLDQSKALREDIRDHIKDLQQQISEKKKAILDASTEKSRGRGK